VISRSTQKWLCCASQLYLRPEARGSVITDTTKGCGAASGARGIACAWAEIAWIHAAAEDKAGRLSGPGRSFRSYAVNILCNFVARDKTHLKFFKRVPILTHHDPFFA
jgi:hypothetical protein